MISEEKLLGSSILIVDDEESIRLTFQLFLNRAGYRTVDTVANISEALNRVREKTPDLIISDIVLEGESGTELLKQLRREGIDCPVVMVTGFPNLQSAAEAVRLGAFDYLSKPVNKENLLHFTRQALKHRWLDREKQELQAKNERYRQYLQAVFRSVQDMIITVDTDLKIVEMNETAVRWLEQKTQQRDFPRNLEELDRMFGLPCIEDAKKVLEKREEVREHQVECPLPDHRPPRVLSLNAAPIKDEAGNFYGVVLVARDVSPPDRKNSTSCRVQFHGYVGISPAMQEVYSLIENVGKFDTTVLVTGESGTGKELAAEALHAESYRSDGPLIKVDCASIPEELLESELFGHRRGAFTGADSHREGRIQQAHGGTLFLDEIGDISPKMQLRLLRFLQERTFYPVGGDTPISVDTRVITATNADLREKVRQGTFREDLYYRLRVIEINLPPLRERKQGIPLLAGHFVKEFQAKLGHSVTSISDQAMQALVEYPWPGNVRELKHVIERACVLCQGSTIQTAHLPREIVSPSPVESTGVPSPSVIRQGSDNDRKTIPASSREQDPITAIRQALTESGGNKAKAARILGIDRSTLYRRMRRYNIS